MFLGRPGTTKKKEKKKREREREIEREREKRERRERVFSKNDIKSLRLKFPKKSGK